MNTARLAQNTRSEGGCRANAIVRLIPVAASMAAIAAIGCLGTAATPFIVETSPALSPDEGILVLQVDTDVAIERLSMSGATFREHIEPGKHVFVLRLPSGSYAWSHVEFVRKSGPTPILRLTSADFLRAEERRFTIESGRINLIPELIVRSQGSESEYRHGSFKTTRFYYVRTRNHIARALRHLSGSNPVLLDRYPLRYGGESGDTFAETYAQARSRARAKEMVEKEEE